MTPRKGSIVEVRRIGGFLALLLAVACEPGPAAPDAGPAQDGGSHDAGPVAPPDVAPPAAPAAPLWTCPEGWIEREIEGGRTCVPWIERPRCEAGELLTAGGCRPLASECGTEAPPELTPAMALVRPGAVDGDGSLARPFGTIPEAMRAGFREIALAPGEHSFDGVLRDVTLVGTCPTTTTLRVRVLAALEDVVIRRARVTGAVISARRGRTLTLEKVELAGMERGIEVHGTLRARRVAFRDLTEIAVVGLSPEAIDLEDVSIERAPAGLWVDESPTEQPPSGPAASVRLARVVAAEIDGIALQASGLASFELEGVVVDGAQAGILATVQQLTVRDAFVRGTAFAAIGAQGEGSRELARIHVEDAAGGIHLAHGTFEASDLVLVSSGLAFSAREEERGRAERVHVAAAQSYAVEIESGEVTLTDLRVRGVEAREPNTGGALSVERGARVTLERADARDTEHFGIGVTGGAALEARDLVLTDVRARTQEDGYGIVVLDGATASLARARVERVGAIALVVEDASARAEDLAIADVRDSEVAFGIGVHVRAGRDGNSAPASVELERAAIASTHGAALLAYGPGAELRAAGLSVEDTRASGEGGVALAVLEGASARTEGFVLRRSALSGVLLGGNITAELAHGRIEEGPFGVLADPDLSFNAGRVPGFSLRDVVFRGNRFDVQPSRRDLSPPAPAEL